MVSLNTVLIVLSIAVAVAQLVQFVFIPWRTKRLLERYLSGLDKDFVKQLVKRLTKIVKPELFKRIDLDGIGAKLSKRLTQSIGGNMSGDRRRLKKLKGAMYMDVMKNSSIGNFLAMLPSVKKSLEKDPDSMETFIFHFLPKLEAMKHRQRLYTRGVEQLKEREDNKKNEMAAKTALLDSIGVADLNKMSQIPTESQLFNM